MLELQDCYVVVEAIHLELRVGVGRAELPPLPIVLRVGKGVHTQPATEVAQVDPEQAKHI